MSIRSSKKPNHTSVYVPRSADHRQCGTNISRDGSPSFVLIAPSRDSPLLVANAPDIVGEQPLLEFFLLEERLHRVADIKDAYRLSAGAEHR